MCKLILTAGLCVIIASLGLPCLGSPPADFCKGKANGNHPNPTDTSSFISCSNGIPYKMPCPATLVYSPSVKVCVRPEQTKPFCQGRKDGNYANPKNSATFISCVAGLTYIRDCQAGLVYDSSKDRCDYSGSPPTANTGFCNGRANGVYPCYYNKRYYYSCVEGVTKVKSCDPGLVYVQYKKACDYPGKAPPMPKPCNGKP
ncbi:chondroitin proteoglycan-2-like [Clinocottus analis]|uniref:chondroitin proteoglycan-2-like n=1 Tax=Clinocottus analis TaxID=304258 RepID=UPI0035C235E3